MPDDDVALRAQHTCRCIDGTTGNKSVVITVTE